ncbi:MAG: short-chain dehydrogenase/reductase [Chitinophagaceae bacterium]|nr:short-chain dehydrogenase/reductase [Chitinophagaceae bacterium]
MKTSNNTVLITGGGSGIGFETAKLLSEKNNRVIIVGRDQSKLDKAGAQLKNAVGIAADISSEEDVTRLVNRLEKDFPELNIVMNNAAQAYVYKPGIGAQAFEKAQHEMLTNYLSVIRLTEKLLPALAKQKEAAIVNVSSVVALVPGQMLSTYAASKAALHSYTQTLSLSLSETTDIKVFELMPPLVDTEFSKEIGGSNGIAPKQVAEELLHALETDHYEIHVGQTSLMYQLYLSSPEEAFATMNGLRQATK